MPIDVADSSFRDESMRIACAGVYEAVLQRICERDAYGDPGVMLSCDSEKDLELWRRGFEQRTAALMSERRGQPLLAHSAHLPTGLPEPFDTYPVGAQRCFTVTPDDVIELQERVRWFGDDSVPGSGGLRIWRGLRDAINESC